MKTSNRNARYAVDNLCPFQANNLYAQNRGRFYVVFSYGEHWPLWVHDNRSHVWYENSDKYSVTTGRHKSQSRPSEGPCIPVGVQDLIRLIHGEVSL